MALTWATYPSRGQAEAALAFQEDPRFWIEQLEDGRWALLYDAALPGVQCR